MSASHINCGFIYWWTHRCVLRYMYVQYVFVYVLLNKGIQFTQRSLIEFPADFSRYKTHARHIHSAATIKKSRNSNANKVSEVSKLDDAPQIKLLEASSHAHVLDKFRLLSLMKMFTQNIKTSSAYCRLVGF